MPQRRAWIAVLAFALVFAQALGLVHRIVHAPAGLADAAAQAASFPDPSSADAPALPARSSAGASSSWAKALFGHIGGDHACHLYDQLNHADLLQPAVPSVTAVPPAPVCIPAPPAWQLAAQAAEFLARAPPFIS